MVSVSSQGHVSSDHVVGLDMLRGWAAICVVIFHIGDQHDWALAPHGYLAVDFFFMLSGYVVGRAYEDRLRRGLSVLAFMGWARWLRLWPTMALGMALGLVVKAIGLGREPIDAADLLNLLLIPTFGKVLYPLNLVAWSIFFELVANLVHALVLPRLTTTRLAIGVAYMGAAMLWVFSLSHHWSFGFAGGPTSLLFLLGFLRAGFAYGAGLLLFRVLRERRVPGISGWIAPAFLLVFLLLPRFDDGALLVLTVYVGWPLVLVMGLHARMGPRSLSVARWLGGISFPLYAIHEPLIDLARAAEPASPPVSPGFWTAILVLMLGAATLVWRCFDGPARRWAAAWASRWMLIGNTLSDRAGRWT